MSLPLARVEARPDGYTPVCLLCNFTGRPRRRHWAARAAIDHHQTATGHRLALTRAAGAASRRPVETA